MTAQRNPAQDKLLLIQSFRGIAALLVVLYHAGITLAEPNYFGVDVLHGFFRFGGHGVDFFFVLSGFIIPYVHWNDIGQAGRIVPYLRKRFVRLYPTLWIVTIPFIFASIAVGSRLVPPGTYDRIELMVSCVFLLPSAIPPVPAVLWTLKHEVLFYLLFCTILAAPRVGAVLFVCWGLLCLQRLAAGAVQQNPVLDLLSNGYNLEFMVGVLCGVLIRRSPVPAPRWILLAGVALFVLGAFMADQLGPGDIRRLSRGLQTTPGLIAVFSAASALLVLGGASLDLAKSYAPPQWMLFLGAASYSVYLVHFPVISATCKLLAPVNRHIPLPALMPFVIVCSTAVIGGLLFHCYVEKPLLQWGRRALPAPAVG